MKSQDSKFSRHCTHDIEDGDGIESIDQDDWYVDQKQWRDSLWGVNVSADADTDTDTDAMIHYEV